jgi:tetratricopeptide (TPR) repeat protein
MKIKAQTNYRRDISPLLRLWGFLLLALVLYHGWIKPTYLAPTPPLPSEPSTGGPAFYSDVPHGQPAALPALPEILESRLMTPGKAPSRELAAVQEDLDRGDYKSVEAALQRISAKKLFPRAKPFLAALWNNLGMQQEKYGGIEVSVKAFEQAVALAPAHPTALLNLTQAYWGLRHTALTPEFLGTVTQAAPHDPFPHLALADILLDRDLVTEASQHLMMARAAKGDANLSTYYEFLTAKLDRRDIVRPESGAVIARAPDHPPQQPLVAAKKESTTTAARHPAQSEVRPVALAKPSENPVANQPPRAFRPLSREHFVIRFDGTSNPDQAAQIRSILEYAYQEMSRKFGHVPAASIPVVLHTTEKFANLSGSPAGADALYDAMSGTIHVPMEGALEDLAALSRVLRHELAHAFLRRDRDARGNDLPAWLAEGLAIQLGEDPWPDLEEHPQETGSPIPLPALEATWSRLPKESWPLAYRESLAAVQALVDRYSMYGVRQLVNAIHSGQSVDGAMQQKLALSYAEFQRAWERAYRSLQAMAPT